MADFQTQPDAPFNAYSWIENDYLNRRAAEADQSIQNQLANRQQATYELEQPQKIAESGLARMVAERDQRLLPMQEEVTTQNIDAEKNFNRLRQMRALMDDESIDQNQKEELLRNGLMRSMGITGQPTLQDAQKMARIQFAIREAQKNPDKLRQQLDKQMATYATNAKAFNAENLTNQKATHAQELALLRGQMEAERRAASSGTREELPKTAEHQALKNAREATNERDRNFWLEKAFALRETGLENKGIEVGNKVVATMDPKTGLAVDKSKSAMPVPGVVPPSRQQAISVGGKSYQVVRENPDGSRVVLVDGKERTVRQK